MKIAIMARAFDEYGGPGIATRNLVDKVIEKDRESEYTLLYTNRKHLGRYKDYPNVHELVLKAPSKLLWDQVAVPHYVSRTNQNVIFQPKFTVPFFTGRPTVTICRGMEYYRYPQFYSWVTLAYVKTFFPWYYRRAARILTDSSTLQDDLHEYLDIPYEKMETVYLAPGDQYYPRTDQAGLASFLEKYKLPSDYILTVTQPYHYRTNKLYPRKNIDNVVKSFMSIRGDHPGLKLVLAGRKCRDYVAAVFGEEVASDNGLVYPGWIPQEEMPYLYSLARFLVFPSYSESFGLPLAEAMACGCPVITSTGGACPEIVGSAGLVVDPTNLESLTAAHRELLNDENLLNRLSREGVERAKEFSWARSAEKVINVFKEIAGQDRLKKEQAIPGH